jgi:limonene 1,2-monooxygenase
VLSVASFAQGGLDDLKARWAIAEEAAAENGKRIDRNNWRLVMPVHLAESKGEALNDVRKGANLWIQEYFLKTLRQNMAFEDMPGQKIEDITIDRMVGRGGAIVGTPDDAIAKIRELQEASGGFGGMLILANDWAPREKMLKSYELWARFVAPQFQGSIAQIAYSNEWARERSEMLFTNAMNGILTAMNDYATKKAAKGEAVPDLMHQMPKATR